MAKVTKREWKSPNGEVKSAYVVRYMEGGKHRSRQFDRKKDADRYRITIEGERLDRSIGVFVADTTVEVAARKFMEYQEQRLSDGRIGRGTFNNLDRLVRVSILPFMAARKLSELSPGLIDDWYRWMLREGRLCPRTARDRIADLKQLCDFAVSRGMLRLNPVPAASRQFRGIVTKPIKTFSPEQVRRLLAAAETRAPGKQRYTWALTRCMVNLAAFCGLRFGEIFGLTLDHVDLNRRVIKVRHSLTGFDELKGPKTKAGIRDVPMPPHVAQLLRDWIEGGCYEKNDRKLIFRYRRRYKPGMRAANLVTGWRRNCWYALLDQAGLGDARDQYHFHALRHFAASWWLLNGVPLTDTANLMGHKSFDLTLQIYAHPLVDQASRTSAFDAMASRLLAPPDGSANAQNGSKDKEPLILQGPANLNYVPDKEGSKDKIDGVVAAVMAKALAMGPKGPEPSVYEERGIMEIEVEEWAP
jgi:integrase